jgi:hypothetical protein
MQKDFFPFAQACAWTSLPAGYAIGFGTNSPALKQIGSGPTAKYGAIVTIGENVAGGSLAVGYNTPPPDIRASLMVRNGLVIQGESVGTDDDTLTVTGAATITKNLAITGTGVEDNKDTLTVGGAATIHNHLFINGLGGAAFALTVSGAAAVSGAALINQSLTINGLGLGVNDNALTVSGAANVSGTATIGGRLIINGATNGTSVTGTTLTVGDTVSGTASIGKSLTIGGAGNPDGVLTVNGNAYLGSSAAPHVVVDKTSATRTGLLRAQSGFISQIEGGSFEALGGQYLGLGALPIPEAYAGFLSPGNNYGLRMNWGPNFGLLQLTNKLVNKRGKKGVIEEVLYQRDLVLGWGGDSVTNLRFRYIGRKNPNGKVKVRDIIFVKPKGELKVRGGVSLAWLRHSSDARMKRDVAPIEGALNKVMALRGVSFLWKRAEFPKENLEKGPQIGFVAQEVEEICPELVSTGDRGIKGIDYSRMTPVLVEAMKEQQRVITDQQKTIDEQKARLTALESALRTLGAIA